MVSTPKSITTIEMLRYEHKVVATQHDVHGILAIIRKHPAVFRRQYPNRIVNNVYFDTPALTSYTDHISGSAHREKKRIRWYGNQTNVVQNPVLERKIKMGSVGEKVTESLQPLPLDNHGPWPIPLKVFANSVNFQDSVHWRLRSLQPVVAIRYERNYFISADNQYRITVDTGLEYFGITPGGVGKAKHGVESPVIIEIKFDTESAIDAGSITNALPYRIGRFSKYVHAIQGIRNS